MKTILEEEKTNYELCREDVKGIKKLVLKEKKNRLNELLEKVKSKIEDYENEEGNKNYEFESHNSLLEKLLEAQKAQANLIKLKKQVSNQVIEFVGKEVGVRKNNFLHLLNKEEIDDICQLQEEITKLENQLEENQLQAQVEIPPK